MTRGVVNKKMHPIGLGHFAQKLVFESLSFEFDRMTLQVVGNFIDDDVDVLSGFISRFQSAFGAHKIGCRYFIPSIGEHGIEFLVTISFGRLAVGISTCGHSEYFGNAYIHQKNMFYVLQNAPAFGFGAMVQLLGGKQLKRLKQVVSIAYYLVC